MKKLLIFFALVAISFAANCQNNVKVQAMIAGYKINDTIKVADFLKLTEISLNNKEYSIVSFELSFDAKGYKISTESTSNKITDQMKSSFSKNLPNQMDMIRIYIEKIVVQKPKSKSFIVEPLVYILRLK